MGRRSDTGASKAAFARPNRAARLVTWGLVLAAGILLLPAPQTAGAASGIVPADATTLPLDTSNQGGYFDPTPGQSPHGAYSSVSGKCKTCHAAHGAGAAGEALLRTSRANACVFCHVGAAFSTKKPYGTDPSLYTTEYENNHASRHQSSRYDGCIACHSVHGANIFVSPSDGIDTGKILRNNPGGRIGTSNGSLGAIPGPVTTLDEFCVDCHDFRSSAAHGCGLCHTAPFAPYSAQKHVYETPDRNGTSHIMTAALTNTAGTQVATVGSEDCRSCHKGAATYADGNSFPHLTSGADFLMDEHTSTSPLDRVCVECHSWNGGAAGVGATF